MNEITKLDSVASFQYFGNPTQICYGNLESITGDLTEEQKAMEVFYDTALAELMKQYLEAANGDIVSSAFSDRSQEFSHNFSQMAVKTDEGITLFLANLLLDQDYVVSINADKEYGLSDSYTLRGAKITDERQYDEQNIYTSEEEYYQLISLGDGIFVPRNSVVIVKIAEKE